MKGTFVFNDGKGALWVLTGRPEADLAAVAKRIVATKEPASNAWRFDQDTVAIAKWSTAFGSYWGPTIALQTFTFDTVKAFRKNGDSLLSILAREKQFALDTSVTPRRSRSSSERRQLRPASK